MSWLGQIVIAAVLAFPLIGANAANTFFRAQGESGDRGPQCVRSVSSAELIELANQSLTRRAAKGTVTEMKVQAPVKLNCEQTMRVREVEYDSGLHRLVFRFDVVGGPPRPQFEAIARTTLPPELVLGRSRRPGKCPPAMRAGQQRTLLVQGRGFRFTVPVRCLGSGGIGEKIRVMDIRTRKIYAAEIFSSESLKVVVP